MGMTEKELLLIQEQFVLEKIMEEKCLAYAGSCDDPQLRMKLESLAGRHRLFGEQLVGQVAGESNIGK